jgi:hypothetical protein
MDRQQSCLGVLAAYTDAFLTIENVIVNSAPWKAVAQRVPTPIRPAAAVECPSRKAKGRQGVSERFPTAGPSRCSQLEKAQKHAQELSIS